MAIFSLIIIILRSNIYCQIPYQNTATFFEVLGGPARGAISFNIDKRFKLEKNSGFGFRIGYANEKIEHEILNYDATYNTLTSRSLHATTLHSIPLEINFIKGPFRSGIKT